MLAGPASLIAERLLHLIKTETQRQRSAFKRYSWQDLKQAAVVEDDDFALTVSVVRLLRLTDGDATWSRDPPQGSWGAPDDLVELLRLSDIGDLFARAERMNQLDRPPAVGSTPVNHSRVPLLELQRSLVFAEQTGKLEPVRVALHLIATNLQPGEAQDALRAFGSNLANPTLSEYGRGSTLRAIATVARRLHREAQFLPPPGIDDDAYARFLRAALRESSKLSCGMTIDLLAIQKRSRLDVTELHAAVTRAVDDDLLYFSDVDEQMYSVQINEEDDVDDVLRHLDNGVIPSHAAVTTLAPKVILFLGANPESTDKLALDEEVRGIESAIRAGSHRDALALKTRWAVQPTDLIPCLLETQPAVLHFSGHGDGTPGLVLHDEVGGASLVDGDSLLHLLSSFKDQVRVVVLNACCSLEQAREISLVIDCVVGMNASVGDEAARRFSAAFYAALAFGRDVQLAFNLGISAIKVHNLMDDQVPVLLVREGVSASDVKVS